MNPTPSLEESIAYLVTAGHAYDRDVMVEALSEEFGADLLEVEQMLLDAEDAKRQAQSLPSYPVFCQHCHITYCSSRVYCPLCATEKALFFVQMQRDWAEHQIGQRSFLANVLAALLLVSYVLWMVMLWFTANG